jgi:hypothetical protein
VTKAINLQHNKSTGFSPFEIINRTFPETALLKETKIMKPVGEFYAKIKRNLEKSRQRLIDSKQTKKWKLLELKVAKDVHLSTKTVKRFLFSEINKQEF